MDILMVAAEFAPLAEVGGVAQYLSGLARSLRRRGHSVTVAIPGYEFLRERASRSMFKGVEVEAIDADSIPVLLFGDHSTFRETPEPGQVYRISNDFDRWVEFSRSVASFLKASFWKPDVIHCHDAHASIVPVLLSQDKGTSWHTVFTIHNLLEQGRRIGTGRKIFDLIGLPDEMFVTYFEYDSDTNCMKAALRLSRVVTTVSPTYAVEIRTSDNFGFGLAGVLAHDVRVGPLGIVNGINEDEWRLEGLNYYDGHDDIRALQTLKHSERAKLIPRWDSRFREPVIAFKGRWDRQKGILLLAECLERILVEAVVIFDSWGVRDPIEEINVADQLSSLRDRYPDRLILDQPATTGPGQENALLYTISDFFIMPSVYEPCGLAQMECQRYGCIPIVRKTGGLADTVTDTLNGFVFEEYDDGALLQAVHRAVSAFHDASKMESLISSALRQVNSWDSRIANYEAVYRR